MKNYLYYLLLTFFYVVMPNFIIAQDVPVVIQGVVLNAENNQSVSKVNVFLSGTTFGVSTSQQGKFTLKQKIPAGNYSLVFSHINYELVTKPLTITKADTIDFNTLLIPHKASLKEVTVTAKKDAQWKKRLRIFKAEFLGTSNIARKCKLLNPWVLTLKTNADTLFASALKEIEIENQALGYKVYCRLKSFVTTRGRTNYLGMYRFEKLTPKDKRQAEKWAKKRHQTFYGSFRHLVCSILYERTAQERFELLYTSDSPETNENPVLRSIKPGQLYRQSKKGFFLNFPGYIKVIYQKEREELEYIKHSMARRTGKFIGNHRRQPLPQSSWVKISGGKLQISDQGVILDNPAKVKTLGYWSWERVGDMLPLDYFPEEIRQANQLSKIQVVKQLEQYIANRPQEKVYLHQDKGYYAIGDTIWIGGYVVDARSHRPSGLSKILHIDLINENNKVVKQLKLLNDRGRAVGEIVLNGNYTPGIYRLRAYTRLMADFEKAYFFNRRFEVGLYSKKQQPAYLSYENSLLEGKPTIRYQIQLTDELKQKFANRKLSVSIKSLNKLTNEQRLKVNEQGLLQGSINLPTSGKAPYLELIAYSTNRKKTFSQRFYIPVNSYQKQVGFFPEGGDLVAGLANRVAFKAVNPQNEGVDIEGHIIDDRGKKVTTFKSTHLGMGRVTFEPKKNRSYKAVIKGEKGASQTMPLPIVKEKGYVLRVDQPTDQMLQIKVMTSLRKKQRIVLIGHSRGEPVYTVSGITKRNRSFVTRLSTQKLPQGIVQLTLFNEKFMPLGERLVFVRKANDLTIGLSTSKKTYVPRSKVTLKLNVTNTQKDTLKSILSVSVIDKEMVQEVPDHTHILSHLLLTSDIKGYVEKPNFYFKDNTPEVREGLDLLMMTQGWRRFTWQKVLNKNRLTPRVKLEQGFTLSGQITTLAGKPVKFGHVRIAAPRVNLFSNTQTDYEGRFIFENLILLNTTKLLIKAFDSKMKSRVRIKLDDNYAPLKVSSLRGYPLYKSIVNKGYLRNQAKQNQLLKALGINLDEYIVLDEIQVTGKKLRGRQYEKRKGMLYTQPTFRLRLDSAKAETSAITDFLTYISGRIPGLTVRTVPGSTQRVVVYRGSDITLSGRIVEPMYLLNGVPVNINTLQSLQLSQVAFVDMLSIAQSRIYGQDAVHGVLAVYLKKNTAGVPPTKYGELTMTYKKGFTRARQFYVPPYNDPIFVKKEIPDFRSTIYWNPYVEVKNGEAEVSFYNADAPGVYKVIVEGISKDGDLGRQVYEYQVKSKE